MIYGDSIYNYLTGKCIRSFGLPDHNQKLGKYSKDDKYLIGLNDNILTVEDAYTGKILNSTTIDKYYNFWIHETDICISYNSYEGEEYYQVLSIPELKLIYSGKEINNYLRCKSSNENHYKFEYDYNHKLLLINDLTNFKQTSLDIDLSYGRYYSYDFLNKNILFICNDIGEFVTYDIKSKKLKRFGQLSHDRYFGYFFNNQKTNLVKFTMNRNLEIYDAIDGELLYSFVPPDNFPTIPGVLCEFDCSFSKDYSHIIYCLGKEYCDDNDDNDVEDVLYISSVAVIKWDSYEELIKKALKEIEGRELTIQEKIRYYLE